MLTSARTRVAAVAAVLLAAAAVTACAPEPSSTEPPTAAGGRTSAPSSSAAPTPTAEPVALPSSCAQLSSPETFASLQASAGPLNDPGMQLYSTQIGSALEVLESGIPTLRCTWGGPSGTGFSTNASVVTAAQAESVQSALAEAGFACAPEAAGVLCTVSSTTVDLNDNLVTRGESQYLDGALWVTTAWVGSLPDGYTEDIVRTLGR